MIMDEGMDYSALKDKLIPLDKNTKAWSGDNFLKNLQVFNQPTSSSLPTKDLHQWKWIRCSIGTKGRAKEKENRKERREAGLVFHTVANLEGTRKDTRANQNTRARKEAKERARENIKREKDMVVETTATPADFAVNMATGK
jgi:hypothetical protein